MITKINHDNIDKIVSVTLECSPTETLVLLSALRNELRSETTHEVDKKIIERMLADMKGDI